MARTNRFQFPGDNGDITTTHERAARQNRTKREHRKGEPKAPKFSLGRLRREIRAIEAWDVIR